MKMVKFRVGLTAFVLAAVLAGCSSTDTVEDDTTMEIEDTSVQTGQVDRSGVDDAAMSMDDAAANIDTVFYFDFDKSLLKPEARAALLEHAAVLTRNPRNIRLEGHGDERGTREYNIALGERRANAVREFLVLQGVSGNLIEVISYGEERPAAFGSNEDAWALNRRVELK